MQWFGGVGSLTPMRLFRAFVHLVLALTVLTAAVAQARTSAAMIVMAPQHHAQGAAWADVAHGTHNHAAAGSDKPIHKPDGCQTACCFAPGQESARAVEGGAVEFFCAVTYVEVARPLSGWTSDPDPEIPKFAA